MPSPEVQQLIERFGAYCRQHSMSAETVAEQVGISKANVQALLAGKTERPRTATIDRVRNFMARVSAPEISHAHLFRVLAGRMRVSLDHVDSTLDIYAGNYRAFRFTPTNRSVIVSPLTIRPLSDEDPLPFFFETLELRDDLEFGDLSRHHFDHCGPVFYREGRLYLLSVAAGNIREMIFTAPLSKEFSAMRGLILTVSAAREPYATRVLLKKIFPGDRDAVTGCFAPHDDAVADFVRYIANALPSENDPLMVR